jgi:hypothetical protein
MPSPTLFLDFDGVLHVDESYLSKGGLEYCGPGELFEYSPILERLLLPFPDVSIVLATPWAAKFGADVATRLLSSSLRARVVGSIFGRYHAIYWERITRCEQMLDYVKRYQLTHWAALDATYDAHWPPTYRDHLVRTHNQLCLGEPRVQAELTAKLQDLR